MRLTTFTSKDNCGVFGVIRKRGAPKISSNLPLQAIECARFRGSNLGAGFASFSIKKSDDEPYRLKIFVDGAETQKLVKDIFEASGLNTVGQEGPRFTQGKRLGLWTVYVQSSSEQFLAHTISRVNDEMRTESGWRARIYSSGRFVDVFKEVGYPRDVAKICGLSDKQAYGDVWIAHTRQPTNSPGAYPIWSHPFASFECGIVHNGDISSFGANMEFLGPLGTRSFVGTDSEVIAHILDYLLRVKKISVRDTALILSNPYERWVERLPQGERNEIRSLLQRYRGAQLDGPFTVVAGHSSGDDAFLIGLVDRSKFRPIVVGEDEERIYIASEECQIRSVSPEAKVWTPEPGRVVLASVNRGLMEAGRAHVDYFFDFEVKVPKKEDLLDLGPRAAIVDARSLSHRELNTELLSRLVNGTTEVHAINVNGQRYMGVNLPKGSKLFIYGTPGNCLANFNKGSHITVYGNAEDDVADAMYGGRITIHGHARDVMGQALQGGEIYVRGNVGNRCAIQMREYHDSKPFIIIGGRVDDYFGEYMAGGMALVLGLGTVGKPYDDQLVGDFVATGMVGGRIYVRSKVRRDSIGLTPPRKDVVDYLHGMVLEGAIDEGAYDRIVKREDITFDLLRSELPEKAAARLKRFYIGKYTTPLSVEYRKLNDRDLSLFEPRLKEFFQTFQLGTELYNEVVSSEYTVIAPLGKEPVPEVVDKPVEE